VSKTECELFEEGFELKLKHAKAEGIKEGMLKAAKIVENTPLDSLCNSKTIAGDIRTAAESDEL